MKTNLVQHVADIINGLYAFDVDSEGDNIKLLATPGKDQVTVITNTDPLGETTIDCDAVEANVFLFNNKRPILSKVNNPFYDDTEARFIQNFICLLTYAHKTDPAQAITLNELAKMFSDSRLVLKKFTLVRKHFPENIFATFNPNEKTTFGEVMAWFDSLLLHNVKTEDAFGGSLVDYANSFLRQKNNIFKQTRLDLPLSSLLNIFYITFMDYRYA